MHKHNVHFLIAYSSRQHIFYNCSCLLFCLEIETSISTRTNALSYELMIFQLSTFELTFSLNVTFIVLFSIIRSTDTFIVFLSYIHWYFVCAFYANYLCHHRRSFLLLSMPTTVKCAAMQTQSLSQIMAPNRWIFFVHVFHSTATKP